MRSGPKEVQLPKTRWSSTAKHNKYADIEASTQRNTSSQRRWRRKQLYITAKVSSYNADSLILTDNKDNTWGYRTVINSGDGSRIQIYDCALPIVVPETAL